MNNITNKIQQINIPAVHNRRNFTTTGKILSINEKANNCTVQYVDNNGYYTNKENVYIKLISPGVIGWFPKVDEIVQLQIAESNVSIIGPTEYNYSSIVDKIKLNKDILSESLCGTIGGSIF